MTLRNRTCILRAFCNADPKGAATVPYAQSILISAHVRFLAVKREMAVSNFEELLEIELFIGEVRKYTEIWNVAAEEYHNRTKKRSACINVCQVFCEGFDDKDERDKNEICKYIIQIFIFIFQ